jgi:hypothetical protein
LVLSLMGFVPDADADPDGVDAVTLKTAIERHYIAKIERLLAPSFTTLPAVSVDVELDLTRVEKATTSTGPDGRRIVDSVIGTPGAVVRKAIAVAIPVEELPAGMGFESFRQLIVSGCNVGKSDRLELLALSPKALTAEAGIAVPAAPAGTGWDESAPLLGMGKHVLWAVVALIVALLGWSVLRQIADRPPATDPMLAAQLAPPAPAPAAPQPVVVNVPAPQAPAPAPRPAAAPNPSGKGKPKLKPRPTRDPLQDVQLRIASDPVRAAEALAGWINA